MGQVVFLFYFTVHFFDLPRFVAVLVGDGDLVLDHFHVVFITQVEITLRRDRRQNDIVGDTDLFTFRSIL